MTGRLVTSSLIERRRFATQVEVATAAADLFDEQGYDATTLAQIAQRAGISLRTLYRHCSGKEDVFTAVLARNVEALAAALRESHDPDLGAMLVDVFAGVIVADPPAPLGARLGLHLVAAAPLRQQALAAAGHVQGVLRPLVARARGADESSLEVTAVSNMVLAAVIAAFDEAATTQRPIASCLSESIALVAPVLRGAEAPSVGAASSH